VGWARTPEMIKNEDGTYQDVPIFSTEAIAKFGMGTFSRGRRAGQPFDLQGMLNECAGKLPKNVPAVIEAFLMGEIGGKPTEQKPLRIEDKDDGGVAEDGDGVAGDDEPEEDERVPEKRGEGVKQIVIDLLLEGAHNQAEIGRIAGCSRQYVRQVKLELLATGRLS